MRYLLCLLASMCYLIPQSLFAQHMGIVRKNYFSTVYDSLSNTYYDVLDSATIRLGSVNPATGVVTPVGNNEYNMGINLTGATINPYSNQYIIASGINLLQFDIATGAITQNVPITGPVPSAAFQNYRFNASDTTIYGLVPVNFYSNYYDSVLQTTIQVLDSAHIRFATLNVQTGQYSLLGNTPLKKVYSLAGNAINPHQMVYYYSAVDTFVAVDLYTGAIFNQVPIQLPAFTMFENFTYSCADSSIYGIVRQNFISSVYDPILMQYIDVVDSVTFRLGKINPTNGQVNIISPYNLGLGATLNGSCFIDPDSMMYYFSNGPDLIGVSLFTGLITTQVPKTFASSNMYFDMMRSTKNCYGAQKVRLQQPNSINENVVYDNQVSLVPNPAYHSIQIRASKGIERVDIYSLSGAKCLTSLEPTLNIASLTPGFYWVHIVEQSGQRRVVKLIKE